MWDHFTTVVVNDIEQEFVCCDNCRELLVYRTSDGTKSMLKHHRSCNGQTTLSQKCSNNPVKLTEYFTPSSNSNIPKRITEKVKMACTEFVAIDCRPFELVNGEGFLKMVQSIFDAGRYFSLTSNINIKDLVPSSITVGRHVDRLYEQEKRQLLKLCSEMESFLYCM
ncbi:unnamed protein product [Adineta ricciae]|uniref:Hermes trasposase DNA-binding domain-containing protein n=2 Tax=Adineta ricciae TaxID=249248 RepID=A0A815X1Z8_ADIRI|nr:unnamed protein product [Adineta ricciae]